NEDEEAFRRMILVGCLIVVEEFLDRLFRHDLADRIRPIDPLGRLGVRVLIDIDEQGVIVGRHFVVQGPGARAGFQSRQFVGRDAPGRSESHHAGALHSFSASLFGGSCLFLGRLFGSLRVGPLGLIIRFLGSLFVPFLFISVLLVGVFFIVLLVPFLLIGVF